MKQFFEKNKTMILLLVLVAAGFYAYLTFFQSSPDEDLMVQDGGMSEQVKLEEELLSTLALLQGLQLDENIFNDPIFQSLEDFSQPLAPQPVGRPDPFGPIGADGGTQRTASSTR